MDQEQALNGLGLDMGCEALVATGVQQGTAGVLLVRRPSQRDSKFKFLIFLSFLLYAMTLWLAIIEFVSIP